MKLPAHSSKFFEKNTDNLEKRNFLWKNKMMRSWDQTNLVLNLNEKV